MLRPLLLKEWLKIRWILLGATVVFLLVDINILATIADMLRNVGHDRIYFVFVPDGGIFYAGILVYLPLVFGLAMAVAQYLPEISADRLKLTFHLPMKENRILGVMIVIGTGAILLVLAFSCLVLSLVTLRFFPVQVLTSLLWTISPWFLAGIVGYWAGTLILLERVWVRRVVYAVVAYFFADLLSGGRIYQYQKSIGWFLLLSIIFGLAILYSGWRYRKGVSGSSSGIGPSLPLSIRTAQVLFALLVILVSSIVLPSFYDGFFYKWTRPPDVNYSPVEDKFLVHYHSGGAVPVAPSTAVPGFHCDNEGNRYKPREAQILLPLTFRVQLTGRKEMPDSIKGHPVDLKEIGLNEFEIALWPPEIEEPKIQLYPLFESKPPSFQVELPFRYFRINDKMEVLDITRNEIDNEMTDVFTRALQKENFRFPAKLVGGNPSTFKPFDEGYFIVDSKNELYHLKMIEGKPFCRNTGVDPGLGIIMIKIAEHDLREYYGLIVNDKNEVFLLLYDQYKLLKLPVEDYLAQENEIRVHGNLFHRMIVIGSEGYLGAVVTDRKYAVVDRHVEEWRGTYRDQTWGRIKGYIFPFSIQSAIAGSYYRGLYSNGYNISSIYLNVFLVVVSMVIVKFVGRSSIPDRIPAYALIAVFGIYGFLVFLLFGDLGLKKKIVPA